MGAKNNRGTGSGPADIAASQQTRDLLTWAMPKALYHLVRLGKWRRDEGDPTPDQLSGAGTLVRIGHRHGILTAAHNIRAKFPAGAYKRQTIEAIVGKPRPRSAWTDIDLSHAIVEGGRYAHGDLRTIGPDIAWIPLHPEKPGFFEKHGKVFFDWREDRFPPTADGDSATDAGRAIRVVDLVTGFSGVREGAVTRPSGPPRLVEVVQGPLSLERAWRRDRWDYEERVLDDAGDDVSVHFDKHVSAADRDAIDVRVDHVGGLSGGAVWRCGADEAGRYFDLAGIVWYQHKRDEDGVLRIVNHGRKSIRELIAPGTGD